MRICQPDLDLKLGRARFPAGLLLCRLPCEPCARLMVAYKDEGGSRAAGINVVSCGQLVRVRQSKVAPSLQARVYQN
jgi:hypothetical protein